MIEDNWTSAGGREADGDGEQAAEARHGVAAIDAIVEYRPLLFAIAYRMLGSVADAEDAVQDTFLRWHRVLAAGTDIASPKAWLTTTVTRRCLDELGSARVRREQYIGPWLPEPIVGGADPAERVADPDSLSMAFLVLLESLSAKERAVFLLHDVFGYEFAEIAAIVGESAVYCRQLAKRARAHVNERRPRFAAAAEEQERLTERFLRAVNDGDLGGLIATLADDVVVWADGGGKVNAARRPAGGGPDKVARYLLNIVSLAVGGTSFGLAAVNGEPGVVARLDGALTGAVTFDVADGAIRAIYIVVNPGKLRSA
ncbi:MAG TPA: RNA polymerase sigma-70 factor, partial [Thermomicrobiales bacterium]|nr:RNA polymerase sigma-70 factor [Thermomicrobiales bacterium]